VAAVEQNDQELEKFRAETRTWLEANCPPTMRTRASADEIPWGGRHAEFAHPDAKLWLERMGAKGWTAPTWPRAYGGGGLSAAENRVLQEELKRIHARQALLSFGILMLGPVILEYGTEEQRKRYLPQIVRGEIRWCQGYSEPEYGSDLAGLQTRAVRDGDHFVVNGSKIWTSYADESDWIFCLVRTNPSAAKHDGISFLLFDMQSPGVSVSPIELISGSSPFCQTFFDNVRVPVDQLVGPENGGWTIAKRLLQHERTFISQMSGSGSTRGESVPEWAKRYLGVRDGKLGDAVLRDHIAQYEMDQLAFGATIRRSMDEAKSGHGPGHAASMFKYYGTELNKRKFELMISVLGAQGLGWEGDAASADELDTTREWLRSKGNSIEGGTSEVQLNVVAKRVLGLPD
jgi:alkylation response protein AidB-like acyl-CoA dehydrogenase